MYKIEEQEEIKEKERNFLLENLKLIVNDISANFVFGSKDKGAITEDHPSYKKLAFILEKIFYYGFKLTLPTNTTNTTTNINNKNISSSVPSKKGKFFSRNSNNNNNNNNNNTITSSSLSAPSAISFATPWVFVSEIPNCIPATNFVIPLITACAESSKGKFRIFIRYALNEKVLGKYISALLFNTKLVNEYYYSYSLFCCENEKEIFLMLLENLGNVSFYLKLQEREVETEDYWVTGSRRTYTQEIFDEKMAYRFNVDYDDDNESFF